MRVAIVHYWLVGMRGGEKVLEELLKVYPQADLYTHVYDPARTSETIKRHRITTTFIDRLPFAKKLYQSYLPLMPFALNRLDLTDYDLVISCESGPTKGVVTHPNALHVCYCHSPMRYIWDQYHVYRRRAGLVTRTAMSVVAPFLRLWDVETSTHIDRFIANSTFVARRVNKAYRRESEVVFPPVDLDAFSVIPNPSGDFYLYVGQLVAYKRVDLAVEACSRLGRPLVVVGTGPEAERLRAMAGPTVEFKDWVASEDIAALYQNCRALLFPGEEDFGIVPLEAMASGRPVIAYGSGGALDTVVDGKTGLFFEKQSAECLADAIERFEGVEAQFNPNTIRIHANRFGREVFRQKIAFFIDHWVNDLRRRPRQRPVLAIAAE